MSEGQTIPTREEFLKEYEFCQNTAQRMEATIWQTSAVMGIGLIGTFLFVGTRSLDHQHPWPVAAIIGGLSFALSIVWWGMAKRWWSIQHAMFMRMRHIEENIGLHSARYVKYLDYPDTIPTKSAPDLTDYQIEDLKKRSKERGFSGLKEYQKTGVQSFLKFFPIIILLAWGIYTSWLYTLWVKDGGMCKDLMYKSLQAISIILALAGTFMLAFGLKVRPGITNELRKKLEIEKKGLIPPSDVKQRTSLVFWGLVLISIAAALQIWGILFF